MNGVGEVRGVDQTDSFQNEPPLGQITQPAGAILRARAQASDLDFRSEWVR